MKIARFIFLFFVFFELGFGFSMWKEANRKTIDFFVDLRKEAKAKEAREQEVKEQEKTKKQRNSVIGVNFGYQSGELLQAYKSEILTLFEHKFINVPVEFYYRKLFDSSSLGTYYQLGFEYGVFGRVDSTMPNYVSTLLGLISLENLKEANALRQNLDLNMYAFNGSTGLFFKTDLVNFGIGGEIMALFVDSYTVGGSGLGGGLNVFLNKAISDNLSLEIGAKARYLYKREQYSKIFDVDLNTSGLTYSGYFGVNYAF